MDTKISELLQGIKTALTGMITADSDNAHIELINGIISKVDESDAEAKRIIEDKRLITERYIEVIKHEGSTTEVKDGAGDVDKPLSLEDCIQAELAKGDKK